MASTTIDIISLTSSDPKFVDSISELAGETEDAETVFVGKKVEAEGISKVFVGITSTSLLIHHLPNKTLARSSPENLSETADKLLDTFGDDAGTKLQSVSFTNPQNISDVLSAPVTELVRFSNPTSSFLTHFESLLAEFCLPIAGCHGAVIGWEVGSEGIPEKKICVGMLGWDSVEHHVAATKKEGFGEAARRCGNEVAGGREAWHVELKKI